MKRVGILRGGKENYDMSLWHGGKLISYLNDNLSHKYKTIDILVDGEGVWHAQGLPTDVADLVHKVDLIWNVAHPNFSATLAGFSVPELGMPENFSYRHPELWKREVENLGLKIPRRIILPLYQKDFDGERNRYAIRKAKEVHEKFSPPWIVKSVVPSEMGVHVANTFNDLVDAIEDGVSHNESIVVEELVPGKREEAHTLSGLRGEDVYAFPGEASEWGKKLHEHLSARHYLKFCFVLHPRLGVYLTDIEFTPDLHPSSGFCRSCESVGAKPSHIIEHLLEQALIL